MINKNKTIPPSVFSRSRTTLGFWAILLEVTSFSAVVAAISKKKIIVTLSVLIWNIKRSIGLFFNVPSACSSKEKCNCSNKNDKNTNDDHAAKFIRPLFLSPKFRVPVETLLII